MKTYKALRAYLNVIPSSEREARVRAARAQMIAERLGLIVSYRKEGEAFPQGFSLYPPQDEYNFGAFFQIGDRRYGWRWALKGSFAHRMDN